MNRPEPKNPPRTFHVKSFGCQMNVYDGERMAEMLGAQGMTAAEDGANADMVVLNTCHIREKAVDKVYSDIGRLRREDGTRPMIAVAGCVAQAEGSEITRRTKMVDIVVGPQAYHRLPELVEKATRGEEALDTDMPAASKFGALPGRSRQARPTAFLTVQEGCDKFCTFASCPIRAAPRSAARGTRCSMRRRRWSMAARARSPFSARM
jgi:tRNA-2-methylthio-N6-dimethylallyladenosine synthase